MTTTPEPPAGVSFQVAHEARQEARTMDLAKRAAVFHGMSTSTAVARQCKKDPEAWQLYVEWHEGSEAPEDVTPVDAIAKIEAFRLRALLTRRNHETTD